MSSSAQDMKDQKRTGDDDEDVQARDTMVRRARNPSDVKQGHLGPEKTRASEYCTQREAADIEGTRAPRSHEWVNTNHENKF